ncbi:MAG: D-aminoacyl-tRNA deacylase [Gammaproteobacteria bacterium]|nr:MAG: D-aminoacyl-tRNA deacylase [Gammaproteobacteria bacterium]
MIGLLQRVSRASVSISGRISAHIGPGLMVLVAIEHGDQTAQARRLLTRLLGYRVFPDAQGRMNLSLADTQGELLLVPQFTLAADTRKGMRASFTKAARPEVGKRLFNYLCEQARDSHNGVQTGAFGADMQVSLINDGPVTFWLDAR